MYFVQKSVAFKVFLSRLQSLDILDINTIVLQYTTSEAEAPNLL